MFDLSGKVAIVSGGNSGLGLGFATGLAKAGADVVIWGRRTERNEAAVRQLRRFGVKAFAQTVDVGREAEVAGAVAGAIAEMGRVDCAVANAGVSTEFKSFLDIPTESYHDLLAANLHGALYTLREVTRHMVERAGRGDPGGSLIVCGSIAVRVGLPRREHYAAAKGALMAITRSMAVEFGPYGIRVNMVSPGRFDAGVGAKRQRTERERRRRLMAKRNPVPRLGNPADLEGIAVYLMSDAARYHTGDVITVDGGLTATVL